MAASTGKTPAELVYGECLKSPVDVVVGTERNADDGAVDFAGRVRTLVAAARAQLERA